MADAHVDGPSLIVRGGPLDGHEEKLKEGLTVIVGSGRLANLRLDHPDIELAHVKVRWDEMGLSMVDNGSRKGTWLNGVPVETAGLLDGDVIEFTAPEEKRGAPCVLLKVPAGSVSEAPLPLQAPPPAPAPAPAGSLPKARGQAVRPRGHAARRGRARPGLRLPDLRIVGLAVAALAVVVAAGWGAKRLFFTAPQIVSIQPPQAEPGATITISGSRFRSDPTQNTVWFGSLRVPAESLEAGALRVKVPAAPPGHVSVQVDGGRGRSAAFDFVVLTPLRAAGLAPSGGVPGDEVTLSGEGFSEGIAVSVDGVAAKLLAVEPRSVRFAIPALAREPGSPMPVVATVGARTTSPLPLVFGRVPLVLSFDPAQATAGELIRIRGAGFASDPQSNVVSFDGVPGLVVAATSGELAVVLPPVMRPLPEFRAPVIVRALGRSSEPGTSYPVLRVEGRWVLRFVAGAADETSAQATVGTEIAPVLLLSSTDASKSVAMRALRLASLLNEAVDRALLGQAVVFEARKLPAPGLGLVGSPDLLALVTPEDAVAYGKPPGLSAHEAPTPEAVASHWAALLNDYVVIGASSGKASSAAAVSPEAGLALSRLRSALPWQYASGISSAQVASLPASLRQKLREVAFTVR
jgi:hypothetical protein